MTEPPDPSAAGPGRPPWRRATVVAVVIAAALLGIAAGVGIARLSDDSSATTATAGVSTGDGAAAAAAAASAAPGVVSIVATKRVSGPPLPPGTSEEAAAEGSGLVLDTEGHILTAQHVIASATKIHVSFADGTKVHAAVLASDPFYDLAVLLVDVPGSALHPLTLGSSEELALGDPLIAIGNPFDLERSVSVGVVSGLRRRITAPNGFALSNAVQTDAPVNHGNSGGPLLDARARVVGVAVQLADSGVDANVGVGFGVMLDAATKRGIAEMIEGRTQEHAWLGVALSDIDAVLATSGLVRAANGALVTAVAPGGPGAGAGVRGGSRTAAIDGLAYCVGGDIVTAVDGHAVEDVGDLERAIATRAPVTRLTLSVVRSDGATRDLVVRLETQPASAPDTPACG